jgi:hypothetical protein
VIITRLIGGLGNQMFQYAVGRRLSYVLKLELKMDISSFDTYKLRKYALGAFQIQENFATPKDVRALTETKQGIMTRIISGMLGRPDRPPKPAKTYIKENYFHFDPKIHELTEGVYLDGYWQSEKYFQDIEGIIRREFTVIHPQRGKNKELSDLLTSCESVSVHVRRGDYVNNLDTNKVHGTCTLDYYLGAIEQLAMRVTNPRLFIFSDDPEWVSKNLDLPMTIVDHNGPDKDFEDLRLMTQCKHHIIANSTLSWWGAWLCSNSNKVVIAPQKWFNVDSYNTKDLIPDSWIKI